MSDMPWAVAWYGNRQCAWLTKDCNLEFMQLNDYHKPVQAIFITPLTMDSRFLSQMVRGSERGWGRFTLDCAMKQEIPDYFPLKFSPIFNLMPDFFFLADYERWKMKVGTGTAGAGSGKNN